MEIPGYQWRSQSMSPWERCWTKGKINEEVFEKKRVRYGWRGHMV